MNKAISTKQSKDPEPVVLEISKNKPSFKVNFHFSMDNASSKRRIISQLSGS
jgi:hypothetical protein